MRLETSGAFACPGCGAVLNDLALSACSYCGAAFTQTLGDNSKRIWYTPDEGATWTAIERQCPGCGSQVTDPAASHCPKCGHQPLPSLDHVSDPRPTVSIKINLPATSAGPGQIRKHTTFLVRYLDCRHWPVPPPVPKAIARLLRPLPDECSHCSATVFDVVLSNQQTWVVVCAECKQAPGVRADAD